MATTTPSQFHEINSAGARRRQLRMMQVIFAGAAAIAMLALFDAARPDTTQSVLASGSVRLTDKAFPQTPPVIGGGGFAADDASDQAAQQQAQQAEQQAMQEMQQAEQQAEEQEELANQQAQQAEQQGLQVQQQANP
jgi:hypothetical protein